LPGKFVSEFCMLLVFKVINSTSGSHTAVRINMASISAVGGSAFRVLSAAAATGGISSTSSKPVDSYQSSSLLPDALRTRFGLLSHKLDGFTLSISLSDLAANIGIQNEPSVIVKLPVEQGLLGGRKPGLNTMACMFWDEANGRFLSDGYVTLNSGLDICFEQTIAPK
jgi:hypothetical protein